MAALHSTIRRKKPWSEEEYSGIQPWCVLGDSVGQLDFECDHGLHLLEYWRLASRLDDFPSLQCSRLHALAWPRARVLDSTYYLALEQVTRRLHAHRSLLLRRDLFAIGL